MDGERACGAVVTIDDHTWPCLLRAGHVTCHRARVGRETRVWEAEVSDHVIEQGTEITWSDGLPG